MRFQFGLNRDDEVNERGADDDEIQNVPRIQDVWAEVVLLQCLIIHDKAKCNYFDHSLHSEQNCETIVQVADEDDEGVLRVYKWVVYDKSDGTDEDECQNNSFKN